MPHAMNVTEIFLIAMTIIFSVPWLVWRLGSTEYVAPLVVVQIIAGILLGPGIGGALFPEYYAFVFNRDVIQALNGMAWWAVMLFVFIAGIELDLEQAWVHRRESLVTAGLLRCGACCHACRKPIAGTSRSAGSRCWVSSPIGPACISWSGRSLRAP